MEAAQMNAKYDLEERLLDFTCGVIDVVESLVRTRAGNHIGGQLIKSGTSPAGNYAEAQSAESRADFVHKLKIVLKELRESRVWLIVIQRKKPSRTPARTAEVLSECEELIRIFHKSIATAERNRRAERTKG